DEALQDPDVLFVLEHSAADRQYLHYMIETVCPSSETKHVTVAGVDYWLNGAMGTAPAYCSGHVGIDAVADQLASAVDATAINTKRIHNTLSVQSAAAGAGNDLRTRELEVYVFPYNYDTNAEVELFTMPYQHGDGTPAAD